MDFYDVASTAWTNRYYRDEPVSDDVLEQAVDAARFAPQGGNRQPVHFVFVRDPATKAQLREWYLVPWRAYLREAEESNIAIGTETQEVPEYLAKANEFAEHLDEIPVLAVVCAELAGLHPTDLDTGRLTIVGGGSVYPAVQNFLLGLRNVGLGGALTTLLCHSEADVKQLLGIPDEFITAATIAIGWPAKGFPKQLNRRPVREYYSLERFGNVRD